MFNSLPQFPYSSCLRIVLASSSHNTRSYSLFDGRAADCTAHRAAEPSARRVPPPVDFWAGFAQIELEQRTGQGVLSEEAGEDAGVQCEAFVRR